MGDHASGGIVGPIDPASSSMDRRPDAQHPAASETPLTDWEAAYLQRLQSARMQAVLEALTRPLDAQARELRSRALDAYRNGWCDDAYADLSEAVRLDRYDFTVHQALGNIALAHREDLDEAAVHFTAAAKYAAPKSAVDAAYAHVSLASIAEARGDALSALRHSRDALAVAPDCPEAHYAAAKYLAGTDGGDDEVAAHLETAFHGNARFCLLALEDPMLALRADVVRSCAGRYEDLLRRAAAERLRLLGEALALMGDAAALKPHAALTEALAEAKTAYSEAASSPSSSVLDLARTLGRLRAATVAVRRGVEALALLRREVAGRERDQYAAAESRGRAIGRIWHYYAFGGAVGCELLVAVLLPLVSGFAGAILPWLFLAPSAVVVGFVGGLYLNRRHVQRARSEVVIDVALREGVERIAERLEGVREQLATGVKQVTDAAAVPDLSPAAA